MPYWPPKQTSFLKLKSQKLPRFKIENLWSVLKTIQTKQLHGEIQSFSKEDDSEKKKKGLSGSRTRDLSHPKRESCH